MGIEILEEADAWRTDGDGEFMHVAVVYRDGEDIFVARIENPLYKDGKLDLSGVDSLRVPTDAVYPKFEAGLTVANCASSQCHRKQPVLLCYGPGMKDNIARLILQEAHVGELLKSNQHPNIAKYWGCDVKNDRIVALCWQKYRSTLAERMLSPVKRDVALKWLEGVQEGILHLHSLRLCHNDINPSNIMISEENTAVIIDFDSCRPEGEPLGDKSGTEGWADSSATLSLPGNDQYSFERVRDFVLENLKG